MKLQGNVEGWVPSTVDSNTGIGNQGSCCPEMDVWEANSISYATTAHPCSTLGQTICEADDCGSTYSRNRYAGVCAPDGCDFNTYRLGNTTFYDPGSNFVVNTESTFTVVTQFEIDSSGTLSSINRIFQMAMPSPKLAPMSPASLLTPSHNLSVRPRRLHLATPTCLIGMVVCQACTSSRHGSGPITMG